MKNEPATTRSSTPDPQSPSYQEMSDEETPENIASERLSPRSKGAGTPKGQVRLVSYFKVIPERLFDCSLRSFFHFLYFIDFLFGMPSLL